MKREIVNWKENYIREARPVSCEVVSASGTCLEPKGVGFPRTLISPQNLPEFSKKDFDVTWYDYYWLWDMPDLQIL